MRIMTPEQNAALDARILTATVNDAIRAIAFGYATREQAEFLSAWEADVEVDRLVEDEMGIFTDEDGREDAYVSYVAIYVHSGLPVPTGPRNYTPNGIGL